MEWIKLSVKLPCKFQTCICSTSNGSVVPSVHVGNGDFWVFQGDDYSEVKKINNPTHWMPMPEAPKE